MDTLKTRLLSLEKKVVSLEQSLQVINNHKTSVSEPIHYVTSTEEFFEIDIFEELNAFRFVYKKETDAQGKPYFSYTLVNPSESMKHLMRDEHGNEENIIIKSYTQDPTKVEEFGYEFNQHATYSMTHPLSNPSVRNHIRKELETYFFRVYDICSCNIRAVNFDQEITINFYKSYKTLPHFHIYCTPFPFTQNLSWKIKELTPSSITITFSFPQITGSKLLQYSQRGTQFETPKDIRLHLWIHGVPKETNENLLE